MTPANARNYGETVKVEVAGEVLTYPLLAAEYGDHTATGGTVGSLRASVESAKRTMRSADWVKSVDLWVFLDDSVLAYHVTVRPTGHYTVNGAAPVTRELPDLYHA